MGHAILIAVGKKTEKKMQCLLALLLTHGLCQGHSLTKTNPTVKTAVMGGLMFSRKKNCRPQAQAGADVTAYRKGEFVFEKKNAIFHKREDQKVPSVLPLPS